MPIIIVMSNGGTTDRGAVTLREDVQPEHITSEHHAAQLIERVGWAVGDAKSAERAGDEPRAERIASEDEFAIAEPWVVVDTTGV